MKTVALFIAVTLATFAVRADDPEKLLLTFQVRPDAKPETLAALARLGVKTQSSGHDKPTTVKEVLTKEYGSSHHSLRDLFAKYNPVVTDESIPAGTDLTFPAASEWRFNVHARVKKDIDAEQIAMLKIMVR